MTAAILNVDDFHFDIQSVKEHSQFPASRIIETPSRQQALLNVWNQEYGSMQARLKEDVDLLNRYKLQRIRFLVDLAFSTTSFYHALYSKVGYTIGGIQSWDDFHKLPIVTKDHLRESFPQVVGKTFNPDKLYGVRTSGSSGKPLTIVLDDHRAHRDTLIRIRQFELLAGRALPEDRWIYNLHHTKWWFTSMLGRYPTFTLRQDCPIQDIENHIKRLKPSVISGLPSTLSALANRGINLQELGVFCVSTNSETSSRGERSSMAKVFQVPVGDEYSSEELGLIATECSCGQYHLVEDECHVEILSEASDSNFGRVVGTDLWNIAMPVIRYDQGDLAKRSSKSKCSCGSTFPILESFQGRTDQNFINQYRQTVSSSNLLDICDQYFVPASSNILEFKMVQKTQSQINLIFVARDPKFSVPPEVIQQVRRRLCQIMGHEVTFLVEKKDKLPSSQSYKRRMIISEVQR